jgi:DtxR family Mn-dependent transcriptional regulator
MQSPQFEEYVEALYGILEEGRKAKTSEIAKVLKVKPASVTEMLRKLSREGYVTYTPYQGATLTKKGFQVGAKLKRKHRLLERFLCDILGVRKNKVHEEACRMEHALSDESERALDEMLGYPASCPDDGKPIPQRLYRLRKGESRLIDLPKKAQTKVLRFTGGESISGCLRSMGLHEGKTLYVVSRQPLGGPVVVKVGNTTIAIGRGAASKIIVGAKS